MDIAIDANEANSEKKVGIGRYAFNVLKCIYNISENKKSGLKFKILLKNPPLTDLPKERSNWIYNVFGPSTLWSQIALPYRLMKYEKSPRLLFSMSHYSPLLSDIKSVISVMDLSYLHYPGLFGKTDLLKLKYLTRLSVKKAEKIITISKFSKSEIVKYYGVKPEKIVVAYPGVDRNIFFPKDNKRGNFILYVGTLQPRKNISGLIKAYEMIKKNTGLKLVIVGKKGWLYDEIFNKAKESRLEKKIIFKDYVTDQELVRLYREAICFILPSFYEGFGIPVVEAMSSGCPVIISNTSSLPEIAGNAALSVNPHNPAEIAQAITKITESNKLRQDLIKKGLIQSKLYNWEKTGEIIYTTLIRTLNI